MVRCPTCGKENVASFRFCVGCGAGLVRTSRAGNTVSPMPAEETAPFTLPPLTLLEERTSWTATVQRSRLQLLSSTFEGKAAPLPEGRTTLGRKRGGALSRDRHLSPHHVSLTPQGEKLHIRDEGSLNGVYRKLVAHEPALLDPGQVFRIGQEILRFEPLRPKPPDAHGVEHQGGSAKPYVGRLVIVLGRQTTGDAIAVPRSGLQLGRDRGDWLFPDDGYVSGAHCKLAADGEQVTLTDLGSSNGTFLRIEREALLSPGETLLVGKQLFRIALAPR